MDFPRAALVGVLAGSIALLFRVALSAANLFRNNFIVWSQSNPNYGWIFPIVFTFLGACISVAITRMLCS